MSSSEKEEPFRLPPPKFADETKKSLDSFTKLRNPHFSTPSGMLLPREKQPPPMYGPRGSTVPPRFLNSYHRRGMGGRRSEDRNDNFQYQFLKGPRHGHYNEDKDVIPELLEIDWSLWCEACDMNCNSEQELKAHLAAHQRCEVPGCQYAGHPKAMKRHWRLAHDEAKLLEKAQVQSKQSPEEIASWREERRKRFPTKENIERRRQAQQERFKRGERIEENKNRFPNRPESDYRQTNSRRGRGRFGAGNRRSRKKNETESKEPTDSDSEDNSSHVPFKGTSELKNYKPKPVNALSLLGAYGSDSENDSDEEDEKSDNKTVSESNDEVTPTKAEDQTKPFNPESIPISDEEPVEEEKHLSEGEIESDSSANEDEPAEESNIKKNQSDAESEQKAVEPSSPKRRTRVRKRRHGNDPEQPTGSTTASKLARVERPILDYRKLRQTRQNTMLEKLLEPDIRHERNVLLQCVRFVVENKFFGIGQTKPSLPSQIPQKSPGQSEK
ncbi:FMR1-interacting protein NUFIP1 [Sabethes cyaneus]|uniref:FMR1-interacting protein NUFIP1 n=1 Tax=Sabethes cyaneus TaxID=53552 RepID=UPI00237DC6C6|nr:FMR1-interacting protein NUFIP1 [Sabethes cyaneus]